jgi:GNAT superfamily N-acetyltransferase
MIRPAILEDAAMIARVHVQAWAETYPGLLPPEEIARRTYDVRLAQWTAQISSGKSRIYVVPDLGFAQFGPQRTLDWAEMGYIEELTALYLLRSAHGLGYGRALLETARSAAAFSAVVLDGNQRACQFYERSGGHLLKTYDDKIGETVTRERVYGWAAR